MIAVLVPELEALLAEAGPVPGRLARLMLRGQCRPLDPTAGGTELLAGQAVACAPLTRMIDRPQDAAGIWLRADPVGLVPDLNAVWLRPGARLDPDSAPVEALRALFAEEHLHFDLPTPERGYLRLPTLPECRFQPPWQLVGQSFDHVLPSGPDGRAWRRLTNEVQVTLHNAAQAGASQVGGLWFWGAGELPARSTVKARFGHVYADDPVLIALADWLNLSHEPAASAASPGDGVLVEWVTAPDASAADHLLRLDRWLKPLLRRLKLGAINAIELASRDRVWRLTPGDAWRFWRQPSAT